MAGRLTVADAAVALHADWAAFQREVSSQGTAQARTAGQKISQALGPTGLQRAFTAAGVAGGAIFTGAIGGAVNFEDQLRTINTVAHLTDDELSGVGKSILDLSKETGKSTDDLTAGFYDLVSAGVPAKDAINVLRDSAKFATGALGSTAEAVDLVTSAMNAYGLKAGDSTRITDIFAQAVADGKVTAAELGSSIASIAPLASSSGIALEEVSAAAAIMTAKGSSASEAFTTMRQAIAALITPNETLLEIQKRTGVAFADVAREKGLAVALEELRVATNGNSEEFAKALGSTQAYQFALASTGENAGAYAAELDKVTVAADKGGVAQAQYDEKMKSAKAQGDKLLASIHALGVEIGGPFTALLGPAVSVVGQLGQGIHGLFILGSGLGGLLGRFLGGAWARVAGAGIVKAAIAKAGSAAATAYLSALVAGDGISSALSGAWSKIAGSSVVTKGSSLAGKVLGSSLGKFAAVAFAAVMIFEVFETYNRIKGELAAQGEAIGKDVGNQVVSGSVDSLEQSKGALEQGIKDLADVHDLGIFSNDARASLLKQLDIVNAELEARIRRAAPGYAAAGADLGERLGTGLNDGATSTAGLVGATVGTVAAASIGGAAGNVMLEAARRLGVQAGLETAEGLRSSRETFDQGWTTFLDAIKNVETPAKRAARLLGRLASKELAGGLNDERPEVRLRAEAVFQDTIDELGKIVAEGGRIGKVGMEQLRLAMDSKNPAIAAAARRVYNASKNQLDKIPPAGTAAGKNATANLVTQLDAGKGKIGAAAGRIALAIASNLLRGVLAGTAPLVRPGQAPKAYALGTPYVPYDQIALIHKGERILTAEENRDWSSLATATPTAAVSASGDTNITNNYNVEVEGLLPARDELAIARAMRRVASFKDAIDRTRPLAVAEPAR